MTPNSNTPRQISLFVSTADGAKLHIRRISQQDDGLPVLMVHGAVANARTFYSEKGKGLASWLAQQGYDVFVLDLRGRGLSTPKIARGALHGQTESICEDIPTALAEIERLRGEIAIRLVAHSWGGVLLSSTLARYPELAAKVACSVYLGSKRSIRVWNWPRIYEIELFWKRLAQLFIWRKGYLPAAQLGMGADDETAKSLAQSQQWVSARHWRDSDDGFDYAAALHQGGLPPTCYLIGGNDPVRGHEQDVRRFALESGPHVHDFTMLSCAAGLSRDYGHIDMLTHPLAEQEVYPLVLKWLRKY